MKKLLIFGASRGTGAALFQYAREQGHECILVIRDENKAKQLIREGLTVFIGDANDPLLVEKACLRAGKDCTIVSTLGGANANYHAQINIINQAEKNQISRMIMVTSLGCGESWPTLSDRAKNAFGFAVREKTLAEVWLQTSTLDFCIFRPGGLVDGTPTKRAQYYQGQDVHGYVMRTDLALLILAKANEITLGHSVFTVIDPQLVIEQKR